MKDISEQTLRLQGPLTIRTIADVHRELLSAMKGCDDLEVVVPGDADVDVSFIQLLLSMHTHARSTGGHLKLSTPEDSRLHELLDRGGFLGASRALFPMRAA